MATLSKLKKNRQKPISTQRKNRGVKPEALSIEVEGGREMTTTPQSKLRGRIQKKRASLVQREETEDEDRAIPL